METSIEVKNLYKMYKIYNKPVDRLKESLNFFNKKYHREFYALNNINFDVLKGETVGIIGKNGSGKSTLLKIITGVLNKTSGNVKVRGKVSALLELGAGFNMEYTGLENIYLSGTLMGYSKEEVDLKIDNILEFADIGEFINQPVKNYSSGMFARLAFSVSINVEPDILIVDEALSVGDVFFQNKCYKKFEELRLRGITILFVSHDLNSIKQMCSRVLWIHEGKQVIYGDKKEVCEKYLNNQIKEYGELTKELVNMQNSERFNHISERNREIKIPEINLPKNTLVSDKANLISFYITDHKGKQTWDLEVNQKYLIHIWGKAIIDLDKLIMGFTLEDSRGNVILTINTYMHEKKVFDVKKDSIVESVFEIVIPKLKKGEYLISPAIAQGNQENHVSLAYAQNINKIYIFNNGYNLSILDIDFNTTVKNYDDCDITFIKENKNER